MFPKLFKYKGRLTLVNKLLAKASAPILTILFYSTGCRISEAISMKWGEIDFARGSVIVTGKGSKDRLVILGAPALAALVALREKVAERGAEFAADSMDVFLSDRLRRISARFVERRMKSYLAEAGLPTDLSPHKLR
ncbi:MAG: tyrosine-type recombinase/integrase, partial [Mycoplasmataceae bacterium]|nr:tyrosine-type recombinase/integrase [Mycoplasmataceae bacterium]